jgi:hypothetical protein
MRLNFWVGELWDWDWARRELWKERMLWGEEIFEREKEERGGMWKVYGGFDGEDEEVDGDL